MNGLPWNCLVLSILKKTNIQNTCIYDIKDKTEFSFARATLSR